MTGEASARSGQQIVAAKLRQLLEQRGLSKRAFARLLAQEGDGKDLDSWERQVHAWTSEDKPISMGKENAAIVARVLNVSVEEISLSRLLDEAEERVRALEARLARIEQLLGLQDGG